MRPIWFLLLLGAAVLLPGLGRLTMERQQELRVALVARDMAESSDPKRWIIPHFQREVRLKKPPLSYWATAGAYRLTGTTRSPFVARLPSVFAGLGLIALTWAIGCRLLGASAGFWAGLSLTLSLGFVRHARLGETDVTLAFFIALGMWVLLRRLEVRVGWKSAAAAGLCFGLAFLAKGPAAIAIPLATGLVWLALGWGRKDAALKRCGGALAAIPSFLLVALPWYLLIWNLPEAQAAVASEANALVNTAHKGSLIYYLYTLPVQFLPWGLLLPPALWMGWKRRHEAGVRMALAWFLGAFLLLTATPSKQSHYCVLLLVPSALMVGGWLSSTYATANSNLDSIDLKPGVGPARFMEFRFPTIVVAALATALFAYVIYPRVNPLARVPAFVAKDAPTSAEARTFVVGINSAVFEYYLGHLVHNREAADLAFRDECRSGDRLLVIDKAKRYPPRKLPEAEAVQSADGKFLYRDFRKP